MSNATKTLLALFVILLVITGLVKFTGNRNESRALRNAVVKFDTTKADRITIKSGKTGDVVLTKVNKIWKVRALNGSKEYKANQQAVKDAMSQVNDLMPVSVVTRDKKKFRRYQVDSTGTFVSINAGNRKAADFYLGRFQYAGPGGITTYIRPAGQNNVYAVNGYITDSFAKKLNNWRDRRIWKIRRGDISQIDMIYPADSSFTAKPVKKGKWISGKDTLDMGIFSNVLNQLTDFTADGFENKMSPNQFGKPLYQIKVHMNNGVVRDIRFKPDKADSNSYIGITNNYPYVFKESKSIYKQEVFRSRKYNLKKTYAHLNNKRSGHK